MDFHLAENSPFIPRLLNVFIMKGQLIFVKYFFCIEITMWFLFFNLLI